ncbi:hypothetical protein QCA50_002243 [Cerrena zonata]|uniref:Uncharacterized protein n=1 Tax=Cerrena zonata TaxID=2478898 RepID=A0AAW0GT62_9APHY
MSTHIRAKVTSRLDYPSRPGSPTKSTTSLSPPPVIRAKAKVNSSANVGARKVGPGVSTPGATAKVTAGSSISRAPSPFKPSNTQVNANSPSVPTFKAKISSSSRPHSVISGGSSDSRPRALTSTSNVNLPVPSVQNRRRGSFSSTLTAPPATRGHLSSPSQSKISVSSSEQSSPNGIGKTVVRVKSKVTRLAEHSSGISASLPPSPSLPARYGPHAISTATKFTPPLPSTIPAPISTPSSPTSVYHRFATTREVHTPKHANIFQPFSSRDDQAVSYISNNGKVDPVSIPLPSQSPPGSTLSFSSRSSASRSSVSAGSDARHSSGSSITAPTPHSNVNGASPSYGHDRLAVSPPSGANLHSLGIRLEPSTPGGTSDVSPSADSFDDHSDLDSELDDPDWERKAEAKSIRKIADLEITNRSLLAINSTLEATKHRQAKEIRDLRRKLRQSRLILPPTTFKAVTSATEDERSADEESSEEEDEEEQAVVAGKTDETYRRVRSLIERLIDEGKRALETKPEDLVENTKGTKVLHEIEARTWRGEDNDSQSLLSRDDDDNRSTHLDVNQFTPGRPVSPSHITVPDDDDGLGSEDEVEASLLDIDMDDIPSAPIPPITVTHSP